MIPKADFFKKRKFNDIYEENTHASAFLKNNTSSRSQDYGAHIDGKSPNNSSQNTQPVRHDNVFLHLPVSLNELYQPNPMKIAIIRNRLCACNKTNIPIEKTDQYTNSVSNSQILSPNTIEKCLICSGRKVIPSEQELTLYLQGKSHNDIISFPGEADEMPGCAPGDVIVIINQLPHPEFTREGENLFIKKKIPLIKALCGGTHYIEHLDGRILKLETSCGDITKPYQIKCIPDEGMPFPNNHNRKGHLFVQFEVQFPKFLNAYTLQSVKHLFPSSPDLVEEKVKKNKLETMEINLLSLDDPSLSPLAHSTIHTYQLNNLLPAGDNTNFYQSNLRTLSQTLDNNKNNNLNDHNKNFFASMGYNNIHKI